VGVGWVNLCIITDVLTPGQNWHFWKGKKNGPKTEGIGIKRGTGVCKWGLGLYLRSWQPGERRIKEQPVPHGEGVVSD